MWRFFVFESALFEDCGGGVVELPFEPGCLALQCAELPALGEDFVAEGLDCGLDMREKLFQSDNSLVESFERIRSCWIVHRFWWNWRNRRMGVRWDTQ